MVCAHERICQGLVRQLPERGLVSYAWKWATCILEGLLVGWHPHKRHPTGSCSGRGCAVLMPRHKDARSGGSHVVGLERKARGADAQVSANKLKQGEGRWSWDGAKQHCKTTSGCRGTWGLFSWAAWQLSALNSAGGTNPSHPRLPLFPVQVTARQSQTSTLANPDGKPYHWKPVIPQLNSGAGPRDRKAFGIVTGKDLEVL